MMLNRKLFISSSLLASLLVGGVFVVSPFPFARQPASVEGVQVLPNSLSKTAPSLLQWTCQEGHLAHQITSHNEQVFLKGSYCTEEKPQKVSLVNLSNGFEATVFIRSKTFLSDLIRLSPGRNQLRVIYQWAKERQQEFSLTVDWAPLETQ